MKKLFIFLTMLVLGIVSSWAIDVKIATFGQPVTYNGTSESDYEFRTVAFSGLADVTITAPNSDVTIGYTTNATYGDGWVNDGYGYCLRLVTKDTNVHTVSLNAPSGYKIVGYSFKARSNSGNNPHVLTPAGSSSITTSTGGVWVTVNGILAESTTFTIQTQNGGNTLYIPQFTISLVASTKKVVDTKVTADKDNPIAYDNIDDIADGQQPVVLYNSGRAYYLFANPYDGIVGGYSSNTGVINTSSVKFLVEKSGEKYKIINADSRKYIPASGNVTMLPSNVSGAPQFTTLDNDATTYTFKSGNSSFNGNPAGYGSFAYWGSAASGNSAYKIMPIKVEENIEYTIPDQFYAPTAYYRIKVAGRGNYYMSAGSSDTYIHLTQDAFDHSGTQVWKTYLGSQGVKLYSMGVNKYVAFNTSKNVQGQNINAFTDNEGASYNFIPISKGGSDFAFQALAPLGNTYLSNNGGVSLGSMGYYDTYDDGGRLQFQRVYRVILRSDTGDDLGYIYSDGNITASDLHDYDYSIGGVSKTKDEVVVAINAVTNDNLVLVCSHQRKPSISSKAEINQSKVYSLTTARGWLYAIDASNTVEARATTATFTTYASVNQWAFVTVDNGETYYLYNVGKKRFLMSRMGGSNFMESKYTIRPVTINTTGNSTYPISFKDGSYTYNVTQGYLKIDSWSSLDDGNRYSVQEICDIDFDPTEAQNVLRSISSNIKFVTSPAPSGGAFDDATTWYFVSMRPNDGNGGYYAYVPDNYNYESPTNIPLGTATGAKEENDNYRWCITGSLEAGYRLYNKSAGANKVFVFDNGGKMKDYSGNESASLFYLAKANSDNGDGSPTFVFKGTYERPNKKNNSISNWGNSDTGSEFGFTFDIEYVDNNFYGEYKKLVKPFMDAEISSNFFYLPSESAKVAVWNASQYSDGVEHAYYSQDDVTAMRTKLEERLRKPTAIDILRLRNNKTGKYASYGQPTYYTQGLICYESLTEARADLTSVIQFISVTPSTYYIYIPTLDKYVGAQTTTNYAFPLVDEASRVEFKLSPTNTPGVIYINNTDSYVDDGLQGYLHGTNWDKPAVVNWEPSAETSKWNIENAETISFDMISPSAVAAGGDVYMTYVNNLGLPIKAQEEASVYIIASKDEAKSKAYTANVESKEIPAGSGVIIKAAKGSTVHMDILTGTTETLDGNALIPGDGSTLVAKGNFMLAYRSTDDMAKFYAIGDAGYVVPANKAYLPADVLGGARTLNLSFEDIDTGIQSLDDKQSINDNVIYNVTGQRMAKVQKGINIVNGKKMFVK